MGRWEPSQRSFRHCASASCLSLLMAMFLFLLSGHGNCLALEANENRNNNILMAQQQAARPGGPIPNDTRQLVLVITKDWNSVDGILRTFERRPGSDTWEQAGAPFPIVVGNRGLGWGLGLHRPIDDSGPKKVEGDKKAPAGVFRLTRAFGYDALETLGISDCLTSRSPLIGNASTTQCLSITTSYWTSVLWILWTGTATKR